MKATASQAFRDFSDRQREAAAEKGHALPDGSFPIKTKADLANARQSVGRAADPEAAKAHIRKRADALGVTLPETFFTEAPSAARLTFASSLTAYDDPEMVNIDGVDYVKGKPLHIFPLGTWSAVDGRRVEFNEQDADTMLSDLRTRRSHVALTYDHEKDAKRGSISGGWMDPTAFELRADGLWANKVYYTKPAYFGDGPRPDGGIKGGEWRYVSGDALGVGTANPGEPFHPRRLLAASLVPKPGFVRGLAGIRLGADETAALHAWLKESEMSKEEPRIMIFAGWKNRKEFCENMKLAADSSDEQVVDAFKKWLDEEAGEPEHKDSIGKRFGVLDDGTVVSHLKDGCTDEKCAHFAAAADDHTADECDDPKCMKHMAFKKKMEARVNEIAAEKLAARGAGSRVTEPTADELEERFTSVGTAIANKAIDVATKAGTEAAEKRIKEQFAADARSKDVEDRLGAALKDGRLKGDAQVKTFRKTFSVNFDHAVELLDSLPVPETPPDKPLSPRYSYITQGAGGRFSREQMFKANGKPDYDAQSDFLSATMRFAEFSGLPLDKTIDKVLKGENEDFEKQYTEADGRDAESLQKAGFSGAGIGDFRNRARPTEIDVAMVKYIRNGLMSGKVPEGVLSPQTFAAIQDFQPGARTTLPMALGYPQADFQGDRALPVFVGGADEKSAWPEYSFEKFAAIASAVGIGGAPTWSSLNIIWHLVTLDKYPVGTKVDRRLRAASVTLPEGIDTTILENLKSEVGVSREQAQHDFLATNGNYFDSSYYPTVSPQWSSSGEPGAYSGLPIDDVTKGLAHVRSAVRVPPDLLILSYNAALAMRKNQQVLDTVRFTGTMERPGTMVSNATLAALFAGMFDLTIVVAEAGSASLPSGQPVSDVWANDAWLVCTGRGAIKAPRFGITAAAAGAQRVRAFPIEMEGADGSDAIVVTDAWEIAAVNNKAAYWLKSASAAQ